MPEDRGAAGLWQRLLKLTTTASLLHVTAHPDDEHAGMLTLSARGRGVRTALVSLNRGEGGANALGPELFDALGLIRTEELRLSGRYYGLDDLYFTTAVDYGFSKTLDEAFRSWDREDVLEDLVRIIRINRPLVVVSRWHGSERDGHGHHQAAGVLTPEAVHAAGDPQRFPEQITREGLRPWTPLGLFRGGVREDEVWHVRVDADEHSPWLGTSYEELGQYGLSLQRSQTSGRVREGPVGPARFYERLPVRGSEVGSAAPGWDGDHAGWPDRASGSAGGGRRVPDPRSDRGPTAERDEGESLAGAAHGREARTRVAPHRSPGGSRPLGFFDGIDTTIGGLFTVAGEVPAPGAAGHLSAVQDAVEEALLVFDLTAPEAVVPHLAIALRETRDALDLLDERPEAAFLLRVKERQIVDALVAALGVTMSAVAYPAHPADGGAVTSRSPLAGPVVPGQRMAVRVTVGSPSDSNPRAVGVGLAAEPGWSVDPTEASPVAGPANEFVATFHVTVSPDAQPNRPYFQRTDLRENRYVVLDSADLHLPARRPRLEARATLELEGTRFEARAPVRVREPELPYGVRHRELVVAPAFSVRPRPERGVVPEKPGARVVDVVVEVVGHEPRSGQGRLRLEAPRNWRVEPPSHDMRFTAPAERRAYSFRVFPPNRVEGEHLIEAVAAVGGREYRGVHELVRHRDLKTRYLYRPAVSRIRAVDLRVAPDLRVGYVMGVGDEVPEAIRQLGAEVELLGPAQLAAGSLEGFDAVVVGTRAYAVRPDLVEANARLLDYVWSGGHLVVLYQTQEFVPGAMAPFPALLPPGAEEVSEEDAPVSLLEPGHPLLTEPNLISEADFEGWVEQRGSKFFSEWDAAYTPLVETHDSSQPPQRGAWLTAVHGAGHYTYLALALHRQLPYAVPGAFRILANVLSLGAAAR